MKRTLVVLLALSSLVQAGGNGNRVQYTGGTIPGIALKSTVTLDLLSNDLMRLRTRDKVVEVDYRSITTLEYGMRVNRRYIEAVLISPVFLVAKRRTHFLTIGYADAAGIQQALVLEVSKADIRGVLVSLEARTGRRVEYQDEEARKAGKG